MVPLASIDGAQDKRVPIKRGKSFLQHWKKKRDRSIQHSGIVLGACSGIGVFQALQSGWFPEAAMKKPPGERVFFFSFFFFCRHLERSTPSL